jgi:hypothetical protein
MPRLRHWLAPLILLAPAVVSAQAERTQRCTADVSPLDYTLPLHRTLRDSLCIADGIVLIGPEAISSTRSGVPDGRGNGAAPAGVGRSLQVRAGVEYRWRWVAVRLAPEISSALNGSFLTFAGGDATRSGQSSPWYFGNYSADLPSRHGTEPITQLDPGESGVWESGA